MLTFIYLVDSVGNVFTTAVPSMDTLVEVKGLIEKDSSEALFEGAASRLKDYCKTSGIHYATEEREFQFSTAAMKDIDQHDVVNITCWRQKELEGATLTQPRHLHLIEK